MSLGIIFLLSICTIATAQGSDNILAVPVANRAAGFQGNGNFNALVFGNLTANAGDVEGRLALSGNFDFNSAGNAFSVGINTPGVGSLSTSNTTDNFIVNANFNNSGNANWQVKGNFFYNTATGNAVAANNTTAGVTEHIKFADGTLITHYQNMADLLSAVATTGTVSHTNSGDPITLTGSNSGLNVFNVTLPADPNDYSGFVINIPSGATVLVNIHNTTAVISGGNMTVNSLGAPSNFGAGANVLFNFKEATALNLNAFALLGSVLAPNATLTATGGSINGQAIIGGNVSMLDGFEFHNFEFTGNIPAALLPVSLIDFTATLINKTIKLNWSTAQEMNTAYFELQHSQNGSDWIKIGTVAATGNSQSVINYSFTDNFPAPSINYYRLKMVDKDGSFIYSTVRKVNMKSNGSGVVVAQNPVINGNLSMQYNNPQNVKTVQLFNAGGAQIYSSSKVSEINVSSIQSGMYILKVSSPDGTSTSQKIIISN